MVRVRRSLRDWEPFVHADHAVVGSQALHGDTTQLTAVAGGVHACATVRVSISAGHAWPPPEGWVMIVRRRCSVRDWLPFAQVVHGPTTCHALHEETAQLAGCGGGGGDGGGGTACTTMVTGTTTSCMPAARILIGLL
jgi:hypothetical protein